MQFEPLLWEWRGRVYATSVPFIALTSENDLRYGWPHPGYLKKGKKMERGDGCAGGRLEGTREECVCGGGMEGEGGAHISAKHAVPRAGTRYCTREARGAGKRFSNIPAQSLDQPFSP